MVTVVSERHYFRSAPFKLVGKPKKRWDDEMQKLFSASFLIIATVASAALLNFLAPFITDFLSSTLGKDSVSYGVLLLLFFAVGFVTPLSFSVRYADKAVKSWKLEEHDYTAKNAAAIRQALKDMDIVNIDLFFYKSYELASKRSVVWVEGTNPGERYSVQYTVDKGGDPYLTVGKSVTSEAVSEEDQAYCEWLARSNNATLKDAFMAGYKTR